MYDSLIKQVKASVDIIDVAKKYGINVNRNNKALCCFHSEKTPSLSFHKEKQIYKCFSCGKGGDVISLVSELLNINALESAKQLNQIFGLGVDFKKPTPNFELNKYKQIQEAKERFYKWYNETLQILCDYLHSLKGIEKLQQQEIVEYYIDLLIYGTEEDWLWLKKTEERWCKKIERELRTRNIKREFT